MSSWLGVCHWFDYPLIMLARQLHSVDASVRVCTVPGWRVPGYGSLDDMQALYAEAATQVERLFPNKATHVPDGKEEEPSSDADDDDEEPAPRGGNRAAEVSRGCER